MMHRHKGKDNHHYHHHPCWSSISGCRSHACTDIIRRWPWMRYLVQWGPVPASLLGWARPSSLLLLFSLCLWVFSSTVILPSVSLSKGLSFCRLAHICCISDKKQSLMDQQKKVPKSWSANGPGRFRAYLMNTINVANLTIEYKFFLVTIMGLVIPWSFTLALVDGYSVLVKCPIRQQGILLIIVLGDWVLSILTLAAACSTASVVDLLLRADGSYCPPKICSRYLISAVMAFLSWFLSVASSLFNLWLLPSL